MKMRYAVSLVIVLVVAVCGWKFLDYLEAKERNDRLENMQNEIDQLHEKRDLLDNYLDMSK